MNLKKIFVTGFLLLLPTMITIFVIYLVIGFFYKFASPLGAVILSILYFIPGLSVLKEIVHILRPAIGFTALLLIIIVAGYLATILGKWAFATIEKHLLLRIPVVSLIYPYAKQFIDTFVGKEKKIDFKAVVSIPSFRDGIYSIGFMTADGMEEIKKATGQDLVTVFIPTTPAPFTGLTVLVPKKDVITLNMTVDEAVRFLVSGGVLSPQAQQEAKEPKNT